MRTEDGKYSGIGDAATGNVARANIPRIIRRAETRAKARALRDAINVGVTALEELDGEPEEFVPVREQGSHEAPAEPRMPREENKNALPATRKQLNYLEALIADVVEDGTTKFEELVGKPVSELTRGEASEWIGRLSGRAA